MFPGVKIADFVKEEFQKQGILWRNCLSLGAGNANVMSSHTRGVWGQLKGDQPELNFAGCVCHLMHIAAEKGGSELEIELAF